MRNTVTITLLAVTAATMLVLGVWLLDAMIATGDQLPTILEGTNR